MKKVFMSFILIIFISISLMGCSCRQTSRFKSYKKNYSLSELKMIASDSFKKINDIEYPDKEIEKVKISQDYLDAIINFSYNIYCNLNGNNVSFAPMGLYTALSIASLACNNDDINSKIDQVLGIGKARRNNNYPNFYKSNYFVNEYGTVQMYNGLFSTNEYEINSDFIKELTNYYCEAYSMNFANDSDINKMLDWIDNHVQEKSFLKKSDLEISKDTVMYIFNTLYFNNKWANSFITSSTYNDQFFLSNDEKTDALFMTHSYPGTCYDYGTYLSAYDRYSNGYKIQYLVPKDLNDSIYDLVKDHNFLIEDEDKLLIDKEGGSGLIINLSVPKFENECLINFKEILKNIGLGILFDEYSHAFDYAYKNLNESIYLSVVKQKNKITFSEDGTIVKSVTVSGMAKSTGARFTVYLDTIDIKLDRPFIYVIYDRNNTPIYMGNLDNPNA